MLQVVCLVLWIPTSFSPFFFMRMKGDKWIHEQYIKEEDDDEEEEVKPLERASKD